MVFYPDERIAIFVDGANFHSTIKSLDFDVDYKRMLELFKGKGRMDTKLSPSQQNPTRIATDEIESKEIWILS